MILYGRLPLHVASEMVRESCPGDQETADISLRDRASLDARGFEIRINGRSAKTCDSKSSAELTVFGSSDAARRFAWQTRSLGMACRRSARAGEHMSDRRRLIVPSMNSGESTEFAGGTTHYQRPVNLERRLFRLRRWGANEGWYLRDIAVVEHGMHRSL
jgi:hypothetical protein